MQAEQSAAQYGHTLEMGDVIYRCGDCGIAIGIVVITKTDAEYVYALYGQRLTQPCKEIQAENVFSVLQG